MVNSSTNFNTNNQNKLNWFPHSDSGNESDKSRKHDASQ
jgi:hypothetical protein